MTTVTAADARDRLGTLAAQVRDTGRPITITADGRPDAALVTLDALTSVGLTLAGAWGVREARADWSTVRRLAATAGPQGITTRDALAAVLVDPRTADEIARGLPVLEFEVLSSDEEGRLYADGAPIPPGRYSAAGGVLIVNDPNNDPNQPEEF